MVCTGRPIRAASAAQSSCSGARLTSSPPSQPRLTRTVPPETVDRDPVALELVAVVTRDPHAQRAGMPEERLRDRLALGRAGERAHDEARPSLLHLRGNRPDVERARRGRRGGGVGDELGREIVEVRLDEVDRRRPLERGDRRIADDDADEVRHVDRISRTGAVADLPRHHRGVRRRTSWRARLRAPRRSASRARRRPRAARAARWPPAGSRASPAPAVEGGRGPHARSPRDVGSGEHAISSAPSEAAATQTPMTSPIASSDPTSWNCTSSGGTPVDQPLGRREPPERVERARLGPGRQRRRLDDLAHVAPGPVHVLVGRDDVDVGRRDPVPLDALEP